MSIGHGREFVCHAVSVRTSNFISAEINGFQFENRVFTEGDFVVAWFVFPFSPLKPTAPRAYQYLHAPYPEAKQPEYGFRCLLKFLCRETDRACENWFQ
jgi:hypothetical protein